MSYLKEIKTYVIKRSDGKYYFTSTEPEYYTSCREPRVAFVESIEMCYVFDNLLHAVSRKFDFERYSKTCGSWMMFSFSIVDYKKEKRKEKIKKINKNG